MENDHSVLTRMGDRGGTRDYTLPSNLYVSYSQPSPTPVSATDHSLIALLMSTDDIVGLSTII